MLPPFVDLVVGVSIVRPKTVLVKQADFAHELASFVADPLDLPYNGREEGLPVKLRWGRFPGNTQTFYGYVHHTEPFYDKTTVQQVKVVCLGASATLSQSWRQSWAGRTADSVVREVAERLYLSVDTEPHRKVWPALTAADGSAWEFFVDLAGRVGYRLRASTTEIRFLSAATLFSRNVAAAPNLTVGMDLTRFRPQLGKLGGLTTRRLAYGLGKRDGKLFNVIDTGADTFIKLGTELPGSTVQFSYALVDSPGDGADKLAGIAASDRFTYEATAEGVGDAFYAPGVIIYLTGVETTQWGHWYISAVEHDIDVNRQQYNVFFTFGRDALGAYAPTSVPGIVQPHLRQTPLGDVVVTSPPTVLINGRWRSGWARRAS